MEDAVNLEKIKEKNSVEVVIDRLIITKAVKERLTESIELALKVGDGVIIVNELPNKEHIFSEKFAYWCQISLEK